jgi:hypothetical protein
LISIALTGAIIAVLKKVRYVVGLKPSYIYYIVSEVASKTPFIVIPHLSDKGYIIILAYELGTGKMPVPQQI